MLRHVDGPDDHILSREQVCAYLRIERSLLDKLISRGEFPRGVPFGDGKVLSWYWEDCWAWRWLRMRQGGTTTAAVEAAE